LKDLPPISYDVLEVEMTKAQEKAYNTLRDTLKLEIEASMENTANRSLVIENTLTKLLRLAQVCSGYLVFPAVHNDDGEIIEERHTEVFPNNPKLEMLVELLQAKKPGEKTIVWACFQHDILAIEKALTSAGIECVTYYGATSDKNREIAEYRINNDPTCKVFIGNPDAGGTGLNLLGYPPLKPEIETNVSQVIYFSQNWRDRSQSEARAHRRGTRVPVQITDLCVPGTVDEVIRTRVAKKRVNALALQDLREVLRSIFNDCFSA
jgi:SNF2 family DNA or RNA helicase